MIPFLSSLLPVVSDVLDRVIPDKAGAEKAKAELALLATKGELDNTAAQIQANVEAAKSPHLFVAGARPACIWLCACILAFNYIIQPLVLWAAFFFQVENLDTLPRLDDQAIMPIVTGLLGLGAYRSYEKIKGTARENLK